MLYVPVVSATGKPLMPCPTWRANELLRRGRAVRRFSKGIFYIRLLDREEGVVQPVACGIDPGSKYEGFTVKSGKKTFVNVQADAVTWVKDAVKGRRMMRHARRSRKTPCRQNRYNQSLGGLPPSTKARWQWKLRLSHWLASLYPVSVFVVEDIKAKTKGQQKWDASFSPLEVGKHWFYGELARVSPVQTKSGWDTKTMRDALNLKKTGDKSAKHFGAHCVDSWVLASSAVGGVKPDNMGIRFVTPLRFHRRQLHALQPAKGGVRRPYGGTRSLDFKRGSLVKHPKWGLCYVGGTSNERISLHSLNDGHRLCRNAKLADCIFFAYLSWRTVGGGASSVA